MISEFSAEIRAALGQDLPVGIEPAILGAGDYASYFKVSELALATTAAAVAEYADLVGAKTAQVDRRLALLWFHLTTRPIGWEPASLWDPIAGDYECADGWVRLHTNAPHHRDAAVGALGCAPEREAVSETLQSMQKADVESQVVAKNGCAAAMYSLAEWSAHSQGRAIAEEPLIGWQYEDGPAGMQTGLEGLKVLDLTRVLAGPVATRFLAGFGADVLRIDPPHWNEAAVEVDVTLGKRCAGLDLKVHEDRLIFEGLLSQADVLVHGYRSDALSGLGYDSETLKRLNSNLINISLCAYGWTGPWATRRGFDSLVQMSCGIANEGMQRARAQKPVPLPVQALDFATGYLVASACLRAIRLRQSKGIVSKARLSLARTAHLLTAAGVQDATGVSVQLADTDFSTAQEHTSWGPIQRIRPPYSVNDEAPDWQIAAGQVRRHDPHWGKA